MSQNLFLRVVGGRYDFRRRVPAELIERLGRREIILSIGSLPFAEAKERARQLAEASDRLFKMAKQLNHLTEDRAKELARAWLSEMLGNMNQTVEGSDPVTAEKIAEKRKLAAAGRDAWRNQLAHRDYSQIKPTADKILRNARIDPNADGQAHKAFCRLILRAAIEGSNFAGSSLDGDYSYAPADAVFEGLVPGKEYVPAAMTPLFNEVFARYQAEKIGMGHWRNDMQRTVEDASSLFLECCGNKPVDKYKKSDITNFAVTLLKLPKNRGKSPRFTNKSLADLAAMTSADKAIRTYTERTVKKHTTNISSFFKWCVDQQMIDVNVATGVYNPKRLRRRNEERDAWSVEQLRCLFTSPIYQGSKSAYHRFMAGNVITRDARYWLPLIAVFHPSRLEEIAQLRVVDIKHDGGIHYFDIHDDEDGDDSRPRRKLKTLASKRRLPIHDIVLELGFLKHVDQSRAEGSVMVFPELVPGGVGERYQ